MKGCLRYAIAALGVIISGLYLLNLSGGFIEIPDNLPIVGNIDEVFMSGVFFCSLSVFGIRLPQSGKRKDLPPS